MGTPQRVADGLEQVHDAPDASELHATTFTHDRADRVRSYELLALERASR